MRRTKSSIRLTLSLMVITIGVVWIASLLGFMSEDSVAAPSWLPSPKYRLLFFCCGATFSTFYCFLQRYLMDIDPARTVPKRVQSALNTLVEGVIILDEQEQIVLANATFVKMLNMIEDELFGLQASSLGWIAAPDCEQLVLPWLASLREGTSHKDISIGFPVQGEEPRVYRVNSTPIIDEQGKQTGALATFNDVTATERNRYALRNMLKELCTSRDEIKRQNTELQVLATRDPLTGCLNRRAFFEQFETQWKNAKRYKFPLACMMVDIDHFKRVNDSHGHGMGDRVLQAVGQILQQVARDTDLVCRYGGEEFCVLLTHTNLLQAKEAAVRLHTAILESEFHNFKITASFGVAEMHSQHNDPQALINEADKCLYVAKRNGRNQVLGVDEISPEMLQRELLGTVATDSNDDINSQSIPFHAVTALFSALSYRDVTTAEHSRRVADLCVVAGSGLVSNSALYMLEVAALLHDIGKIGVPDVILLKPDALNEEERRIMSNHSRIGVEILHSAFSCPKLTDTVRMHELWYEGDTDFNHLPHGEDIPLAARLLSIANAYDAMTSDRVYRAGRTPTEAFEELRRFAGSQFDPNLVEHFVNVIGLSAWGQSREIAKTSKQSALQIGLEIERLANMVDAEDISGVKTLAGRLKETARKNGVLAIAQSAAALEAAITPETKLPTLLPLIQELLELCRYTQRAFIQTETAHPTSAMVEV